MSEDERAIRQLVDTWFTATKEGDLAAILDLMTDDVIFTVPGQEPFGKQVFAAANAGLKDVRIEGSCNIQEIQVLGDWAYLRNQVQVKVTPPGGGPAIHRAGYTLTIVRKEADGRWRLTRDANVMVDKPMSPGLGADSAA